jgi:hypothetical protein
MPTYFPSYTKCTQPNKFSPTPWGPLGAIIATGGMTGVLAAISLYAVAGLSPATAIVAAGVCGGGITLIRWWLDVRLICLGGDRSAIGAIYSFEPFSFSNDAFDNDYSFNLLLWGFAPPNALPLSFTSNEWSASALPQLAAQWPTFSTFPQPWSDVADLVTLVAPQSSMSQPVARYGIKFDGEDVNGDKLQHFILHCEIEGPGMRDALIALEGMLGMFVAAAIIAQIPVWGPVLSWLLIALAFLFGWLAGSYVVNNPTSPPKTGGFGGSFNTYDPNGNPADTVDLAYVYGRWVCDTGFMHGGGNELHPVYFMCKIGETTNQAVTGGQWPAGLNDVQNKLNNFFGYIGSPAAADLQQQPQNQWNVHPVIDGCQGPTPYPQPPTRNANV